MKRLAFFLLLSANAIFTQDAIACTCMPMPTVEKDFAESTYVVAAQVEKLVMYDDDGNETRDRHKHKQQMATWRIHARWKGNLLPGDTVLTFATLGGLCQIPVQMDDQFLLYLHKTGDETVYTLYGCGRTGSLIGRLSDIPELERLSQATAKHAQEPTAEIAPSTGKAVVPGPNPHEMPKANAADGTHRTP